MIFEKTKPEECQLGILGSGSFGTALALNFARANFQVSMYARNEAVFREMKEERTNKKYLPHVTLDPKIQITNDLESFLEKKDIVFCAVPSHALRGTLRNIKGYLHPDTVLVNLAKGLELQTNARMSDIYREELPTQQVVFLSGPSHAEEVAVFKPTSIAITGYDEELVSKMQSLLNNPYFRIYTNMDRVGVELGGVLKNIMAIAAGILDGLDLGINSKSILITRGLAEMQRFVVFYGGKKETLNGLSGLGDLIVTTMSSLSRNWNFGYALAQGKNMQEARASQSMVVEGVNTTKVVHEISSMYHLSMPIAEELYQILYEGKDVQAGIKNLMEREARSEEPYLFKS